MKKALAPSRSHRGKRCAHHGGFKSHSWHILIAIGLLIVSSAQGARATLLAEAFAGAGPNEASNFYTSIANTPVAADSVYSGCIPYNGGYSLPLVGFALAHASADYGTLHAYTDALARTIWSSVPVGAIRRSEDFYTGSVAIAIAQFSDNILVTSSHLSNGTPVDATVGFSLHAKMPTGVLVTLGDTTGESSRFNTNSLEYRPAVNLQPISVQPNGEPVYVTVNTRVGDYINIGSMLRLITSVMSWYPDSTNLASIQVEGWIDASNTAFTSLAFDNPDVDYVADSGARYLTILPIEVTSVPEPVSGTLLALGLAGLVVARSRADRFGDGPHPGEALQPIRRKRMTMRLVTRLGDEVMSAFG